MTIASVLTALAAAMVVGGVRTRARRQAVRARAGAAVGSPGPLDRARPRRPGRARRRPPRPPDPVGTLPELLDLLGVAASAGLPVAAALEVVAPRAPAPWSGAVGACLAAAGEGALLAEALPTLTEHAGEAAGPLVGVLRSALVDGDRLVPGLAGLAADARDLRRRRAQEAAGRLPVRLLAPLVACSLPAVAVLTIVPIVAGALAGLRLEP